MKDLESFIAGLLSDTDKGHERLLQALCAIQRRYSFIPEKAIHLLTEKLHLPSDEILSVISFYAFLHTKPRGDFDVLFSNNITDTMRGSKGFLATLCDRLGVKLGVTSADNRVTIDLTSCTGICDQGPALLVNGIPISKLDEERILKIAELIETNTPIVRWPESFFIVKDNIKRRDMLLSDEIVHGSSIDELLKNGAESILDVIEQSGLRGRGGAGFQTAKKWRVCRETDAIEHYVVCNADEGEPGTFKDRILLNSYADNLIEGMTLCAGVVGAKKGYLYLRGEYYYLKESLEKTLETRRHTKLLGRNILGRENFDFDIEIHLGAGAYICGEESALIESLEGKRGIPRNRPPYPVTNGLHNRPTVVSNVETFVAAAKIATFGADWFRSIGTEESTGTKLLSISGDCDRAGIYEFPFGVTINHVLEECGAVDTQAVQISGAAGLTISPAEFERKISFEDISTGGSFMIFNQQRNLLDMALNFSNFFCHESCGFCTPCRVGSALMKDLINKLHVGHATGYDINEIKDIGHVMQQTSHCGLGASAPNSILDIINKFPDIYTKHLLNRSYEPAFDIDLALETSRRVTGRDDDGAHIGYEK